MSKNVFIIVVLLPFFVSYGQVNEQNLSLLLSFDGEPYIAVNPSNPDNLIAGWMRLRLDERIWIAVRNSFDGGQSWGRYQFLPHTDTTYSSADVSIVFHNSGTTYLSYVDVDWSDTTAYVYVTKSTDGGSSWSAPVVVFRSSEKPDKPVDRPWITVDNSGTSTDGTVYTTAMTFYSHPYPHYVYIKYSADGGNTWSAISRVDDESYPAGRLPLCYGSMGVDGHGGLYVAYYSYEPTISPFLRLIVARTHNVDLGFHYSVVTPVFLTAADWTTYHNGYSLSANPLNSTVAIAWTDNRYGDYDILLSISKDGGETWSTPSRINDDHIQNGVLQDKIWTNYSIDGNLSIIWRDRRHGGTGDSAAADIYGVISTDNGHSFSNNYRLSTKSAPYEPIPCCNSFISVKTMGTTLYAIWADDRYSDWDVFFSKMNFGLPSSVTESDNKTNNITFNTFPNPANEKISMSIGALDHEELNITIFNLLGQRVFVAESMKLSDNEQTVDIDIRNLSTGTYILVIRGKGFFAQKRFNVIK